MSDENYPGKPRTFRGLNAKFYAGENRPTVGRVECGPGDNKDFLIAEIARLESRMRELEEGKDGAYLERNRLVALLASLFPSVRTKTAIEGWSDDWHGCIYIDLPTGQVSWHYHDSHAELFDYVPWCDSVKWDGHTTDEKYERVRRAAKARKGE